MLLISGGTKYSSGNTKPVDTLINVPAKLKYYKAEKLTGRSRNTPLEDP